MAGLLAFVRDGVWTSKESVMFLHTGVHRHYLAILKSCQNSQTS